jgi:hypothetical protein
MRNISDRTCIKKQDTFYVQERFSENRAGFEIMWENMVEQDSPQTTTKYSSCLLRAT